MTVVSQGVDEAGTCGLWRAGAKRFLQVRAASPMILIRKHGSPGWRMISRLCALT